MVSEQRWSAIRVEGSVSPLALRGISDLVARVDPHLKVHCDSEGLEHDPTELVVVLASPGNPELAATVMSCADAGATVVVFGALTPRARGTLLSRGIPVISSDEEQWFTHIVRCGLGSLPERARNVMQPLLKTVALTRAEAHLAQVLIDHPQASRAEIASLGKVTESTLKVHLRSIRRKTGLSHVRGAAFTEALKEIWPLGVTTAPTKAMGARFGGGEP